MIWKMALSMSHDPKAEGVACRIVYAAAKLQGATEEEARAIEAVASSAIRTARAADADRNDPAGPGDEGGEPEPVRIELGFDGESFRLEVYEPDAALTEAYRRQALH